MGKAEISGVIKAPEFLFVFAVGNDVAAVGGIV